MEMIAVSALKKSYRTKGETVVAVKDATVSFARGETVAVVGPSGSGKSTLLNMIGLIIPPDEGTVQIDGRPTAGMSDRQSAAFRSAHFGYITQDFALLNDETVYANIRLPLQYNRSVPRAAHRRRILEAAERLGVADKLKRRVSLLSGGERQRVAIARAIVCGQPIILADEPTGSLDAENRDRVVSILRDLARERGTTVIVVTHDSSVAERCDRVIRMKDGAILSV